MGNAINKIKTSGLFEEVDGVEWSVRVVREFLAMHNLTYIPNEFTKNLPKGCVAKPVGRKVTHTVA